MSTSYSKPANAMVILQGIKLDDFLERIEEIIDQKINEKIQVPKKEDFTYWTRKEVAKYLHITLPTLHEWTKHGIIPGYRIGTRVLYKSNEVEAAIVKRRSRS